MILIVDDDPNIREVVRFTLESGGYQVTEARDGAEALTIFGERVIDLIVLDIVMPESDGLTVCRTIRAGSAPKNRVPIMFVSAQHSPQHVTQALVIGVSQYLPKTTPVAQIVEKIRKIVL